MTTQRMFCLKAQVITDDQRESTGSPHVRISYNLSTQEGLSLRWHAAPTDTHGVVDDIDLQVDDTFGWMS